MVDWRNTHGCIRLSFIELSQPNAADSKVEPKRVKAVDWIADLFLTNRNSAVSAEPPRAVESGGTFPVSGESGPCSDENVRLLECRALASYSALLLGCLCRYVPQARPRLQAKYPLHPLSERINDRRAHRWSVG